MVVALLLTLVWAPLATAEEDSPCGIPKGTDLRATTLGELDSQLTGEGPIVIQRAAIKGHWVGDILREVRSRSVVFDRCRFEDGITLRGIQLGARLEFDRCEFSIPPVEGGRENVFQVCSFSGPLLMRQCRVNSDLVLDRCTFGDSLLFDGCLFRGRWRFDRCPTISSLAVRNSQFLQGGEVTGVVQGALEVVQCDISGAMRFQKAVLRSGLSISQSRIRRRSDMEEGPSLEFTESEVLGRLDARDVQFEPVEPGVLAFHSTRFEGVAGIRWASLRGLCSTGSDHDTLSTLRQIEAGYRRQGLEGEGDAVLMERRERSAQVGNLFTKAIHVFMDWSSGWGKSPEKLAYWFVGITGGFWLVYVMRLSGGVMRAEGRSIWNVLKLLLICFSFSFRVTILQHDEADRKELASLWTQSPSGLLLPVGIMESSGGQEALAQRLRLPLQVHRVVATVFITMLSACIGVLAGSG